MLKSLIIKLRHKPKVVRDQIALLLTIIFIIIVLAIWFFTASSRLEGVTNQSSYDLFSDLREQISEDGPDFESMTSDLIELASTTITQEAEVVIPNEFPTGSSTESATNTRPIRLATTTATSSSSTQNTQ